MKRMAVFTVCAAVLALGLVGCDWDTGSDATSWSSAYNWVNFSGVYRSAADGLLVTDYTTTPATPGSTNTLSVANESQGSFQAMQTTFSGNLNNANIAPGSVEITLYNNGGVVFQSYSDNGNSQLGAGEGNVSYVNGSWNLDRGPGNPVTEAGYIRANYSYYVSNEGSAGSGARPGSTGARIYSFNVLQRGQNLTLTDNNGATYTGVISEMRSASGVERGDEVDRFMPTDGDTIIAAFECSGVSAAGMQVRIVGTFQGTVAARVFTGRALNATWIEAGGRTGDVRGQTTTIPIVVNEPAGGGEAAPAI